MLNIGPQELMIILLIALLVVGPQRLPELWRSIGRGLSEMRRAQDEVRRTIKGSLEEEGPPDGRQRPTRAAPGSAGAEPPPAAVGPEPPPVAASPPPADEIREVSRTLGRSLADLRRAREEVQRSFRVDLPEAPRRTEPRPPERKPPEPGDPSPGGDGRA